MGSTNMPLQMRTPASYPSSTTPTSSSHILARLANSISHTPARAPSLYHWHQRQQQAHLPSSVSQKNFYAVSNKRNPNHEAIGIYRNYEDAVDAAKTPGGNQKGFQTFDAARAHLLTLLPHNPHV